MGWREGVAVLCLALSAGHAGAETVGPALDFELSDGRGFVRLSALPGRPAVVNFWRTDCPPCVRELPLLSKLAQQGEVRVIAVALQRPSEIAQAPAALQQALTPPLLSLHGPREPRGLLSRFGSRHGALPYTVILDDSRRPCAQRTGEIDAAWVSAALARCGIAVR